MKLGSTIIAAGLVAALLHHQTSAHNCIHSHIMDLMGGPSLHAYQTTPVEYNIRNDTGAHHSRALAESEYQPIRFIVNYDRLEEDMGPDQPVYNMMCKNAGDSYLPGIIYNFRANDITDYQSKLQTCTAGDVLTAEKKTYLKNVIMKEAVAWFQRVLKVPPVSNIKVQPLPGSSCYRAGHVQSFGCCEGQVPPQDQSTGYSNTDFVLYVSARPAPAGVLAYALTCQSDALQRPIVGYANFAPAKIDLAESEKPLQVSTAIHEISHALGFSGSKFPDFRKPGTTERADLSSVIGTYVERGSTVTKIITPNVVNEVKKHFDCPSFPNPGAELENYGGAATAGSHWEKRLFANEFMTGTADPNSVYSAISLALFEDSGWYRVNYSQAETLVWGYGEGCDFVSQKCSDGWSDHYFCTKEGTPGCTIDMRYKASCNLESSRSGIPPEFQYFEDPSLIGNDPYFDYCPFYRRVPGGDCQNPSTKALWFYGEKTGSSSRCFSGTYQVKQGLSTAPSQHYGCLEVTCNLAQRIVVTLDAGGFIGKTTVTCPQDGGAVDLDTIPNSGFRGTLICPPATVLCRGNPCDFITCSGHGTCIGQGTCMCQEGFYGSGATPEEQKTNCDLMRCPANDAGVECSGHGDCDRRDGVCKYQGIKGCYPGFKGEACDTEGCPTDDKGVECSGNGVCQQAIECSEAEKDTNPDCRTHCECNEGFIGSACDLSDCPNKCSGDQGECDGNTGVCICKEETVIVNQNAVVVHYEGSDCADEVSGPRVVTPLTYTSQLNGSEPYSGVLSEKEYQYFSFRATSIDFEIKLEVTVDEEEYGFVDKDTLNVLVSYASDGLPRLGVSQFIGVYDSNPLNPGKWKLSLKRNSANEGAFNKEGEMIVALLTFDPNVPFTIAVDQDACRNLNCSNGGICVNGVCDCTRGEPPNREKPSWTGPECTIPDCPNPRTSNQDCGGNGECVVENGIPTCKCFNSWEGTACQEFVGASGVQALTKIPGVDGTGPDYAGEDNIWTRSISLNPTEEIVFAVYRNEPRTLVVRLDGRQSVVTAIRAPDPILLARDGEEPQITEESLPYATFDSRGWSTRSLQQRIVASKQAGISFIKVRNGYYGSAPLIGNVTIEMTNSVPVLLSTENGACNGKGNWLQSKRACSCDIGYEGDACDVKAPFLRPGDIAPTGTLNKGDWAYFVVEMPTRGLKYPDQELHVTLTRTSSSPFSEPVLLVGMDDLRRGTSLAKITEQFALVDYDAFSNSSSIQTVKFQRSAQKNVQRFAFIGVQNRATARAPFRGDISVQIFRRKQAFVEAQSKCLSGTSLANCTAVRNVCHSRLRGSPTGTSCSCQLGWREDAYCNTPLFDFNKLLVASQTVASLCPQCSESFSLGTNELKVYKVPQPLQKATALRVEVSALATAASSRRLNVKQHLSAAIGDSVAPGAELFDWEKKWWAPMIAERQKILDARVAESEVEAFATTSFDRHLNANANSSFGIPALMVSPYLPRSLVDFTAVATTGNQKEEVVMDSPSSSSRYYIAVFAQLGGDFQVKSDKALLPIQGATEQSFFQEVLDWLVGTTSGLVLLIVAATLLSCVCCGCVAQHCAPKCCTRCAERRLAQNMAKGKTPFMAQSMRRGHNFRTDATAAGAIEMVRRTASGKELTQNPVVNAKDNKHNTHRATALAAVANATGNVALVKRSELPPSFTIPPPPPPSEAPPDVAMRIRRARAQLY